MNALYIGVAIGLIPYAIHRVDKRLAQYKDDPPIATKWANLTYKPRRWRHRKQSDLIEWFVHLSVVASVLGHRRWRVTYVSVCVYGSDREQGGVPPHVASTSWHWTRHGANWHRRHNPNYGGWGSFRAITQIDKAPTTPFDVVEWAAQVAA